MAGYLIARNDITDPAGYRPYQEQAPPLVGAMGGRLLAFMDGPLLLEGGPAPGRLVIASFPSLAATVDFYRSPQYQAMVALRAGTARMDMNALEGLPDAEAAPNPAGGPPRALMVAWIRVTDPDKYEGYKKLSPGALAAHGGRFLARGGESITLEGPPVEARWVMVEFPSLAAIPKFYDSPEYLAARTARAGAAEMTMLAAEYL